jgi:hypothetical protein
MLDTSIRTIYRNAVQNADMFTLVRDAEECSFDDGVKCLHVKDVDFFDPRNWSRPTKSHIISLAKDYMISNFSSGRLYSLDDAFTNIQKLVSKHDESKFLESCGDGYYQGFNDFDGSVGVGYQLELGFSDVLHLSMVHIYYGK